MSIFSKFADIFKPKPIQSDNDVLRDSLMKHGDDGTKAREVLHMAYFKSPLDAATYRTFLQDLGFTVDPVDSQDEGVVEFSKSTSVVGEQFDAEHATLVAKAAELNGQYDGWGCGIEK